MLAHLCVVRCNNIWQDSTPVIPGVRRICHLRLRKLSVCSKAYCERMGRPMTATLSTYHMSYSVPITSGSEITLELQDRCQHRGLENSDVELWVHVTMKVTSDKSLLHQRSSS